MREKGEKNFLNGNALKATDFFVSPSRGYVSLSALVDMISDFMREDKESKYQLVIGTDSQVRVCGKNKEVDYVSAIIAYRKGSGAIYFWRKVRDFANPTLRDKIYMETLISLDIAQKIVPSIRDKIDDAVYDLEIHIDVGPVGQTRDMIKEVVSIVSGNGFTAKTKPHSWGASSVADKYT
jgi:hypothetical protein